MYRNLYWTGDTPSYIQLQSQRSLLRQAQEVLQQAHQDAGEYKDGRTEEHVQAEVDERMRLVIEGEEAADARDITADDDDVLNEAADVGMDESIKAANVEVVVSEESKSQPVGVHPEQEGAQSFPSLPTPPRSRGHM